MIPPLRSFDDVDGKERGQKKTDDLRAMTALGPRTLLPEYTGRIKTDRSERMESSTVPPPPWGVL